MSVLGTGLYGECTYVGKNSRTVTRFIQEATLNEVGANDWTEKDVAYIFITDCAEKCNWDKNIGERVDPKNGGQKIPYIRLEKILEEKNWKCRIVPVRIKDGKDNAEMWDIFNVIYGCVQDEDELYFDLTHAFRYLPMLVLVLGSYAKFLKNIKIAYMAYGNYEARARCEGHPEKDEAPIVDLLPLSVLQDWTFAAGQFVRNGNVDDIVRLCRDEYLPLVKATKGKDTAANALRYYTEVLGSAIVDFRFCRGTSLISAEHICSLRKRTEELGESMIESLNPVLGKIIESFSGFDGYQSVNNAYRAAVWCYNRGLYQQSATLLQEAVITFFCRRHGLNELVEDERRTVNNAFYAIRNNVNVDGLPFKCKEVINDSYVNEGLAGSFDKLSQTRNNFNHAGMKRDCKNASSMQADIEKSLEDFKSLFTMNKVFINYSNHPSDKWCEAQISAARAFGEIVDLPFAAVNPYKSDVDVEKIAETELRKILDLARGKEATVHIMGEQTLTFALIKRLQGCGIRCVASTSERIVRDVDEKTRVAEFNFVRFREY